MIESSNINYIGYDLQNNCMYVYLKEFVPQGKKYTNVIQIKCKWEYFAKFSNEWLESLNK